MEWNISKRDMMEAGPSNGSTNPSKKEIEKTEIQKTENQKNEISPEIDDSYGCSTDYVALWTCKLCYSCILHISHIAVHITDCQKKHKKKHPLSDELSYMCNFCGIIYKRFDLMQQHLKQKHGKPAKKDKEVQANDPLVEKLSKLSVKNLEFFELWKSKVLSLVERLNTDKKAQLLQSIMLKQDINCTMD